MMTTKSFVKLEIAAKSNINKESSFSATPLQAYAWHCVKLQPTACLTSFCAINGLAPSTSNTHRLTIDNVFTMSPNRCSLCPRSIQRPLRGLGYRHLCLQSFLASFALRSQI